MSNPKGYANPQLLITSGELAARLDVQRTEHGPPTTEHGAHGTEYVAPNATHLAPGPRPLAPVLLDLRPAEAFAAGCIPTAVHLDLFGVSLIDTDPAPLRAFLWMIEHLLASRGVSADRPVVVYDEQSGMRAARAFWFLEYFDHPDVRLLDGGFGAWARAGLPVTSAGGPREAPEGSGDREVRVRRARASGERLRPARSATTERTGPASGGGAPRSLKNGAPRAVKNDASPPPKAQWSGARRDDRLATWRDVADRLGRSDVVVLDTRSDGEYCGTTVRAKRGGAIPGAVHIEWTRNLDERGEFRSAAELRAMYERAGVAPEREVLTYCQGGYRAAHSYLALRLLGYPRVRNYLGSWGEWGNRDDLPVEVPAGGT